jgi:DNA phosphorothioation-dependent restriction protein DptH
MSNLVNTLLRSIQEELSSKIGSSGDGQYRGVFFGPPEKILNQLLDAIIDSGGLDLGSGKSLLNPVLLPSRQSADPPNLHTSGRCSDSHLVKVRTSECRQFLILLPPGRPMNESMETTIQQMGVPPSESRRACRTPFFERLLSKALGESAGSNLDAYLDLANGVLRSELVRRDEESQDGTYQWGLLKSLFDRKLPDASNHDRTMAILGLFACESNQLDFRAHYNVLERLAELLESMGIRQGFETLKIDNPELVEPLDACMQHIRKNCTSGSDFKEAPAWFYSPINGGGDGCELPKWWSQLSLDCWTAILESDPAPNKNDLVARCVNCIVPVSKGLPHIVQSAPEFQIVYGKQGDCRGGKIRISRKVGGKIAEDLGIHEIPEGDGALCWGDPTPPNHRSHLEYIFQLIDEVGQESKPLKARVIALEAYEPGLVVYCRNAAKVTPFKEKKKKAAKNTTKQKVVKKGRLSGPEPAEYENTLELHGIGMHQIDLYTASGLILDKEIIGHGASSEKDLMTRKPINPSGLRHAVSVIETDEECRYVFKAGRQGSAMNEYWINIEADDESPVGADSEFDRLVIEHQKKINGERSGATIEPSGARCSDLQRWMLQNEHSYRPLIIGPDFEQQWTEPDWEGTAMISAMVLLRDPRPSWEDMSPPREFLELRKQVLQRIGNDVDGSSRLVEEVNLGDLMKEEGDEAFGGLMEKYISAYNGWLRENYESAAWCDVVLACKADSAGGSLNANPYAIVLSPLHPLRLAWHCKAHQVLKDALDRQVPCPAASTLDPATFPDCMMLPARQTGGGNRSLGFLAVGCSSDYWHVLWGCDAFEDLASAEFKSLFGAWFGVGVDSMAAGFSGEQVKRSIDEMRRIYSAKSTLRLLVESDSSGASSCNEGIAAWAASNLGPDADPWFGAGTTRVEVIDTREEQSQPTESQVARMSEISGGSLSWYSLRKSDRVADLAVLAHLGTANPGLETRHLRSAVGRLGLSRWRIRRQTGQGGRFIAETRIGARIKLVEGLAGQLNEATFLLENSFGEIGDAYVFAPNLPTLSRSLKQARYCAVSSSTLDPACFFGQMDNFYLWDYDLPSYSRRAGENSGYYLLASESPTMTEAITAALRVLDPSADANKDPNLVHGLLVEIANRGMPTLKRLTSGGSAALGELGMLVALRLLQGEFIRNGSTPGIVPVRDSDEQMLTLIVPVDPFVGHFDALRRSMGDRTRERPDLLIVSIKFGEGNEPTFIQLTPVEVKARSVSMPSGDRKTALQQASKFGVFLRDLWELGSTHEIWGIAWKHLLCSWVDYGFRVYGQLEAFRHDSDWSLCHQNVLASILQDTLPTAIDIRGRLVVVDQSNQSDLQDGDGDRYSETIIITHSDAHKIVTSPDDSNIAKIVEMIGNWQTCSAAQLKPRNSVDGVSPSDIAGVSTTFGSEISGGGFDSNNNESEGAKGIGRQNTVSPILSGGAVGGLGGGVVAGQTVPQEVAFANSRTCATEDAAAKDEGVRFAVGTSIAGITKRELYFQPSSTELNQLNIGVVGDLGTGKTQLLQTLLYNLHHSAACNRGVAPNILIFDYKKDYSKPMFVESTGARVVQPFDIPLNLFDTATCTNNRNPWLERSLFFSDILSKIFSGIGPRQKQQLKTSIKSAYERAAINGIGAPTIYDVFEKYGEACGTNYDSPYSIMSNIVDQGIFVDAHNKTIPFNEFLKGVVVIDLGALGQDDDTKNMLVAIFLNLFYENMLRIEKKPFLGSGPTLRALDSFLLVDEADNIMRYEFEVLRKVLLQGREFGVGVVLASQYPSHFKTAHENYAETLRSWFIHKVPDISLKGLHSMGFTQVDEDMVVRIKELECHQCLYRSHGVEGAFMRGHPLFELLGY